MSRYTTQNKFKRVMLYGKTWLKHGLYKKKNQIRIRFGTANYKIQIKG